MHSILSRYLTINPQQINPFNLSHHGFVPSDDPGADAAFLGAVLEGKEPRFYVTLSEQVNRLRFNVLVVDKYNQNVAASLDVGRPHRPYASLDEYTDAVWQGAASLAAELGAEFRPEPEDAAVHSLAATQLLRRACERNYGIPVTDWPQARGGGSGITPPCAPVTNLVAAEVQR